MITSTSSSALPQKIILGSLYLDAPRGLAQDYYDWIFAINEHLVLWSFIPGEIENWLLRELNRDDMRSTCGNLREWIESSSQRNCW
jgi:hypothetical protein